MCLSQTKVTALIVQKWVWSKTFRARYAHSYILCPHNHKHLPTPMPYNNNTVVLHILVTVVANSTNLISVLLQ